MNPSSRTREPRSQRRGLTVVSLVIALLAGGALMSGRTRSATAPPPGRLSAEQAWPEAHRGRLPGNLADGPLFQPLLFLDAGTALGTASSSDGKSLRLVLRDRDGGVRTLRHLGYADEPVFDNATAAGDEILWTETKNDGHTQIWAARTGGPARRLTADTGNPVFYGTQDDLVVAGGRVYWAAGAGDSRTTEIRSVALSGGAVRIRRERGSWGLSRWPWLSDGGDSGTTMLRDMSTNRDIVIHATSPELATCNPDWCRMMVMNDAGLVRVDLMRPDGSGRRTIAGSGAQAALSDVAVLDRFEVLSEPGPDSDLTGAAALVVYDISTRRTVVVAPAAKGVFFRNGVLWWQTGDQETTSWHSVDLRTA